MNARQAVMAMCKGHKVKGGDLVLLMDEMGDVRNIDGNLHFFGLCPEISEFEIYTKEQEVKDAVHKAVGMALAEMDELDCVVDVQVDVKV